jgi:hypothetical protein
MCAQVGASALLLPRLCCTSDFAHLKTIVGGVMGTVVIKDANEQPTLIALLLCAKETKQEWEFLYTNAHRDFGGALQLHRNDAFKGSLSAALDLHILHQSCVRHLAENVAKVLYIVLLSLMLFDTNFTSDTQVHWALISSHLCMESHGHVQIVSEKQLFI